MTAVLAPPPRKAKGTRLMTSDQFADLGMKNGGFELIDGTMVEKNMSVESDWVGGKILTEFNVHLKVEPSGFAFGSDTIFRCFPDFDKNSRKADVSFVSAGRVSLPFPRVFDIPPDLAVEVLSPNDKAVEVEEKVEQYLAVGVRQVWVVNPLTRTASIHRADGSVRKLHEADEFDGEDVIPGLKFALSAVLLPKAGAA